MRGAVGRIVYFYVLLLPEYIYKGSLNKLLSFTVVGCGYFVF